MEALLCENRRGHCAPSDEDRDILLRDTWAKTLSHHGINVRRLRAGKIRDDKLATAAALAGFCETAIIQIIRLFNADSEKIPEPVITNSSEERLEVIRKRAESGKILHHIFDKDLSEVNDHHGAPPERKPKATTWTEIEMQAEAEEAELMENLDRLDEVPRRMLEEWREKKWERATQVFMR